MQTFQTVLTLIEPNLKDVYCSVKTDGNDTRFLKFLCNSKLLKFVDLSKGFSPGP